MQCFFRKTVHLFRNTELHSGIVHTSGLHLTPIFMYSIGKAQVGESESACHTPRGGAAHPTLKENSALVDSCGADQTWQCSYREASVAAVVKSCTLSHTLQSVLGVSV